MRSLCLPIAIAGLFVVAASPLQPLLAEVSLNNMFGDTTVRL